ncbi:MAG: hypothetical protein DIU80_000480 [Chloroflexota bacterium]|nr:MAG: hypothetical protein DIU80_08075 [Chloroflexota bacterium]
MRLENGLLIIDLTGSLVTLLILTFWTALGWTRGFRYILTIALFTTLGYLLSVRADVIVSLVNGLYSFIVRFFNFISPVIAGILPAPPIVPANAEAPLLLRVVVFVIMVAVGIGWTGPWEGQPMRGWSGSRQLRLLGGLTGLYSGILIISATAVFWAAGRGLVSFPPSLTVILNSLPTFAATIPVFLAAFIFLLLIVSLSVFLNGLRPAASGGGGGGGARR